MSNSLELGQRVVATYSIVACDLATGELGVGVQSKFLAVGAIVPWAKAGVGAIATQAWANTGYGPAGLSLLEHGLSPQAVIDRLVGEDPGRDVRQLGMINARGEAAAYTGEKCTDWAGHLTGPGFACQGNILAGEAVVRGLAEGFTTTTGDLATRMVAGLEAAQRAGGDRRGRQSAALLIVKDQGGYGGYNDRFVDLRVDDHPEPVQELKRLLSLYRLYFYPTDPKRLVQLSREQVVEIQALLARGGYYPGEANGHYDELTRRSLERCFHMENLEGRLREDEQIDGEALVYLREKFGYR